MGEQPLRDFIHQYEPYYGEDEIAAVVRYLRSGGWLMEYNETRMFEKQLEQFFGVAHCSLVSNGTMALFLALKTLGIGPGDEVIVPDLTMAATPNAVLLTGAIPVFVDIERTSMTIDIDATERAISERTRAIIHVSLNGRAGRIVELQHLCEEHSIHLIEDAAQSLGSLHRNKYLGTFGVVGIFSLSAQKIITTGQGGVLITNDADLYEKAVRLKNFGRMKSGTDCYEIVGWNCKFTDFQAAFGLEQFRTINNRLEKKKHLFRQYAKFLLSVNHLKFIETNLDDVSPWFIDVLVERREELIAYLKEHGIGTRPMYPALHTQRAYQNFSIVKATGPYPVSKMVAECGLWLPSSLSLTDRQVKYICENIVKFYKM